jgi:hypothetical protein
MKPKSKDAPKVNVPSQRRHVRTAKVTAAVHDAEEIELYLPPELELYLSQETLVADKGEQFLD